MGDDFAEGELVGVLTTQPLDRVLDYLAPEGGCQVGDFVEVPFGPRRVLGVVWGAGTGDWDRAKVRSVARVLDAEPMRQEMRVFLGKVADYTLTPMPSMLRLATRAPGLGDPPAMRRIYRLGTDVPDRLTEARPRSSRSCRNMAALRSRWANLPKWRALGRPWSRAWSRSAR